MAADSPESSSLGARLKSAREAAGLTLIQAAERLHVDAHLLEALEGERFEELGASVYVRGHIRHYAELVGESPGELQALYATSAHAARTPDLTRVPKGEDSAGASSALLVPAVLVVGVVAVIGIIWWVAGTLNASHLAHRGSGAVLKVPAAAREPVPASASAPAFTPAPAPASALKAPPAAGPTAAVPARPAALRMHFAEDSWAEVYDARGQRLFYDIGSADSTRTVSGIPPLRIVLGNPAGVSLELDGRPVSIPNGAERNVSVRFRITSSGHAAPAHLAAAAEQHASTASVQAP